MRALSSLKRSLPVVIASCLLTSCATSRYEQAVDSVPEHRSAERMAQILTQPQPEPIREPLSRRGNADEYEVWGKTYQVQKGLTDYSQQGIASWYGQKFHGHETSNGEIFDVFEFTAAHKSLPLPSYVRVTNLANQQSLIVRVNDRGPFHDNRLIDLSYAAAVRLGFDKMGTAEVNVELIAAPLMNIEYKHIQVEAFSQRNSAEKLKQTIEQVFTEAGDAERVKVPVYIQLESRQGLNLHKVRIGPVSPDKVERIQGMLLAKELNPGMVVPQPTFVKPAPKKGQTDRQSSSPSVNSTTESVQQTSIGS